MKPEVISIDGVDYVRKDVTRVITVEVRPRVRVVDARTGERTFVVEVPVQRREVEDAGGVTLTVDLTKRD